MDFHRAIEVTDRSDAGQARRVAATLADQVGLDPSDAGRLALVVTEAATNIVKHAGRGTVLLRPLREAYDHPGVELLALDRGKGIPDLARALEDGYSTAGSPGTGLGAISRMATTFDLYSLPGRGTALLVRVLPRHARPAEAAGALRVGGVRVAAPGESECGDAWSVWQSDRLARVLVADGLGHGALAADASAEAVRIFRANLKRGAMELLEAAHLALQATRGAAVALAEVDLAAAQVRFCSVGNVAGQVSDPKGDKTMVGQNGTVGGGQFGKVRVFSYPWSPASCLVMHTDGLTSHVSLQGYPGLRARHPALVAGVLYRDFQRGRDDATVVVASEART